MSRSKKLFLFLAIVFVIFLGWASYDISSRTTFPGSKPQLKERIKQNFQENSGNVDDTIKNFADSVAIRHMEK